MNLANIRERLSNGFRPFVVEVSSGRRFEVPHPEFIMVGKNVIVVLGRNDVATTIDALHIVSIKDLPPKGRRHKPSKGGT
jgi:hypothetical protein